MMPNFRDQLRAVRVRRKRTIWERLRDWTTDDVETAPSVTVRDQLIRYGHVALAEAYDEQPNATDDERMQLVQTKVRSQCGALDPLTVLWLLSMVVQLVRLWREWKENK